MHSLAKIAFSVLFWGLVFAELCWKRPIKNDNGFALPKYRKILPLNVFNDKIVGGGLWYSFMSGLLSDFADAGYSYSKSEVSISRPTPNTIRTTYEKFVFLGMCFYNDAYNGTSRPGAKKAEFFDAAAEDYSAYFTSDPDSYVWIYSCLELKGSYCPFNRTYFELFTRQNAPSNINFESIGKDLRESMCLTMNGIPDLYTFFLSQGENTCPEFGPGVDNPLMPR